MSAERSEAPPIRATYRLQFHRDFTFRDATDLVPYLAALGISHVYASPITEARPGSTHGYDIINHNRLNPEIGSEKNFHAFTAALRAHGMGLIVDFVPNHMGIGPDNAWWLDVLEWGQESPFAIYFDINWHPARADLEGRMLLPVLGDQYGVILEQGDLALRFDPAEGSFSVWYFDHRFPISPRSYAAILAGGGEPLAAPARDFAAIARLPAAAARERAAELKHGLAERACFAGLHGSDCDGIRAIHRIVRRSRKLRAAPPTARRRNPIASPIGGSPARRSIIAASSTSTTSPGLRMELPELFDETHQLMFQLIGAANCTGCASITSMGCSIPAAYCTSGCNAATFGRAALRARREDPGALRNAARLAGRRHHRLRFYQPGAGDLSSIPRAKRAMTRLYRRMRRSRRALRRRALRLQETHHAGQPRQRDERAGPRVSPACRCAIGAPATSPSTACSRRSKRSSPRFRSTAPMSRDAAPRADDRRYIDWALGQANAGGGAAPTSASSTFSTAF